MPENPVERLVARPASGRTFSGRRRARFGDISPGGRLRLDAIARYVQDVSSDDTADSRLENDMAWIVRRSVVEVHEPARFRELLELTTWCSGLGARWAERRVSITGEAGAAIEAGGLWVHVDAVTGRPIALAADFSDLYENAAQGRRVRARLGHDPAVPEGSDRARWWLRLADFDMLAHVNNAAYWTAVEEALGDRSDLRAPIRAELEYRLPIERGHEIDVVRRDEGDGSLSLWLVDGAAGAGRPSDVYATGRVWSLA